MNILLNLTFILLGFVLIMLTGRELTKLNTYLSQVKAPAVRSAFTAMMMALATSMAILIIMSILLIGNIASTTGHGQDIY